MNREELADRFLDWFIDVGTKWLLLVAVGLAVVVAVTQICHWLGAR